MSSFASDAERSGAEVWSVMYKVHYFGMLFCFLNTAHIDSELLPALCKLLNILFIQTLIRAATHKFMTEKGMFFICFYSHHLVRYVIFVTSNNRFCNVSIFFFMQK